MEELKNKWQDRIDHYKLLKATTIDCIENYELPVSEYRTLKHKLKSLDDRIELCSEFLTDLTLK